MSDSGNERRERRAEVRKGNYGTVGIGLFLVALGYVLSSVALAHGRAVFDKHSGTVTFERVGFLFRSEHLSFPLSDIRLATVQPMGGGSYRFIVVLRNGRAEDIVGSTGAAGQYRAAEAVNEFLGAQ
jgi:hypothetical protein